MQHKKTILTAVILSGSIGLGVSSISAQTPGGKPSEQPIPERVQPPAGESRQPGTGPESRPQGTTSMPSNDVKKIKEALKARGHDPGSIDDKMDSKTQQALRDFQKANNLPVTGMVDQQTATKLGIGSSSQPGSRQPGQEGSSSPRQEGPMPQRGEQGSTQPGAKEAK